MYSTNVIPEERWRAERLFETAFLDLLQDLSLDHDRSGPHRNDGEVAKTLAFTVLLTKLILISGFT
jgi:hypothetical protein